MKATAVETPGDDGHIHIIPVRANEEHEASQRCYCNPSWDEGNRAEWRGGEVDFKIFIHRSDQEMRQ